MRAGLLAAAAALAGAAEIALVSVEDHVGLAYRAEPVSFDVDLPQPLPLARVRLAGVASQAELLAGSAEAATRVRLWTLVDLRGPGQLRFAVRDDAAAEPAVAMPAPAGRWGALPLAELGNAVLRVRVPWPAALGDAARAQGEHRFARPVPAWELPAPVAGLALPGGAWLGCGYLDSRRRVAAIAWDYDGGTVFRQLALTYRFAGGGTYRARLRLGAAAGFVELDEDADLDDDSRTILALDGIAPERYLLPGDSDRDRWKEIAFAGDGADFIGLPGQRCLARLVIWSQHNYFRTRQETLAVLGRAGAATVAIGGFLRRPDRWTRAKVNHIDLFQRPEVAGDAPRARLSRGITTLPGAEPRLAFEGWLTGGHREWALFLREQGVGAETAADGRTAPHGGPPGPSAPGAELRAGDPWIATAHVRHGIWPLDRLNRMPLVWRADGRPPTPDDRRPGGRLGGAGVVGMVLSSAVRGRMGLQVFNGSNPVMRGGMEREAHELRAWAAANPGARGAEALQAAGALSTRMAGPALAALMCIDDSVYPGPRAHLPWTHPEALNPFWQGMENMNFNVDRYTSALAMGEALAAMDCPWAPEVIGYCRAQFEQQLDRYVYPASGCWEESHGYASTVLKASAALDGAAGLQPFADPRVQAAHAFWTRMLSPRDPGLGGRRVVPPIGDHGLNLYSATNYLPAAAQRIAALGTPQAREMAGHIAWSLRERGFPAPADVEPLAPPLRSAWLQGYGSVLRAPAAGETESMVVVRAGQSWGHHHQDKGSLWFWAHGVHLLGDAAWGRPPGDTYWNPYKQGPAGHTTLEFVGVNNWPLPCKFPAPWIAEERYGDGVDYVLARCRYPYNPKPDLRRSTPAALVNGNDRRVLFVHPDILIVRDVVESACPTIWRAHVLQADGLAVAGATARLASPQGVAAELALVHPAGASLTTIAVHDLPMGHSGEVPGEPFGEREARIVEKSTKGREALLTWDSRSVCLRWDMPIGSSATWVLAARADAGLPASVAERLDEAGRVVRVRHGDGREVIAFLGEEPFAWSGAGIEFAGEVGCVVRRGGEAVVHRIRCARLDLRRDAPTAAPP